MNTPPSEATNQYPETLDVAVMPTIGLFRWMAPVEPWKGALKEKIPQSEPKPGNLTSGGDILTKRGFVTPTPLACVSSSLSRAAEHGHTQVPN